MAPHLEVKVVSPPCLIFPASATPKRKLYLSSLDQYPFYNIELSFVFSSSPETDVVELLREGLSKVLVPYHFAAGRYEFNEEENRLEIDCNAAGALFAAAEANLRLEQVEDLTTVKELFLFSNNVSSIQDIPLLTLQVTKFSCGGLTLSFCASHVVFDGISLNKFFRHYASMVSGGEINCDVPDPDRTYLKARSPVQISYAHGELSALPVPPVKAFFHPANYDPRGPATFPMSVFKTFSFSLEMLDSLKQKAVTESGGSIRSCSSFEVLAAHIWQAWTKALHDPDSDQPSKLLMIVNCREKLCVPQQFVGNAIIAAPCLDVPARKVCDGTLSFRVQKVQQAIAKIDMDYVRSVVDWCELNHGFINFGGGLLITTWSKLGYDKVDFGWGKPRYVAPLVHSRVEFVTFLPNCCGDGGVDVFVGMRQQHKMDAFQSFVSI